MLSESLLSRDVYISEILSREQPPTNMLCPKCQSKQGLLCCEDCFSRSVLFHECCLTVHQDAPFHSIKRWTGLFFQDTSLDEEGFTLHLCHGGGSRFGGWPRLFTCHKLLHTSLMKATCRLRTTHKGLITRNPKLGHFFSLLPSPRMTVHRATKESSRLSESSIWCSCKTTLWTSDNSGTLFVTFSYTSRQIWPGRVKRRRQSPELSKPVSTIGSRDRYGGIAPPTTRSLN